jgi:hypothetical protein
MWLESAQSSTVKSKFSPHNKVCLNDIWISYHTESKKECSDYLKYYWIVKLTIWKANHFLCNLIGLLTAQYVAVIKTCKMNGWNMKIMPEKTFPNLLHQCKPKERGWQGRPKRDKPVFVILNGTAQQLDPWCGCGCGCCCSWLWKTIHLNSLYIYVLSQPARAQH